MPSSPFVHIRKSPEFHDLLLLDRSTWPRCLLWHGWLPAHACSGGAFPWATSDDDIADARLERMLGPYSESVCREWVPSDRFLADLAASDVSDHPDVWTECSVVLDELSGVGVGGCGVYSLKSGAGWFGRGWGHWSYCLLASLVLNVVSCLARFVVLFSLSSVLSFGELSLHCSAALPFTWGVDNLNVCSSCFSNSRWSRWW